MKKSTEEKENRANTSASFTGRHSIARGISIGYVIVIAVTIVVIVMSVVSMKLINDNYSKAMNHEVLGMYFAGLIETDLQSEQSLMESILIHLGRSDNERMNIRLENLKAVIGRHNDNADSYKETIETGDKAAYDEFAAIEERYAHYAEKRDQFISEIANRDGEASYTTLREIFQEQSEISNQISIMTQRRLLAADDLILQSNNRYAIFRDIILLAFVISVALAIIMSFRITRRISVPLSHITRAAASISRGEQPGDIDVHNDDEIGRLADVFRQLAERFINQETVLSELAAGNYMQSIHERSENDTTNRAINKLIDSLNHTFVNVRSSADALASDAAHIADAAQRLSSGASAESQYITDFTGAISHIKDTAVRNSETARSVMSGAQDLKSAADMCVGAMDKMLVAMNEIDARTADISGINKIIDDIAFQTNILALNAAVEAARAGSQGKGFGVVADEVRELASRSAGAAQNASDMIAESAKSVLDGNVIVNEVNEQLQLVRKISDENSALMSELFESSQEQSDEMTKVKQSIDSISQVVNQTSSTAGETAESANKISSQSETLRELIHRYITRHE